MDWSNRDDVKVDLILLLVKSDYSPVGHGEVYQEIFEEAEDIKKFQEKITLLYRKQQRAMYTDFEITKFL